MATKNSIEIKKMFLAGFMILSTSLVFLIWADSLFASDKESPYYYRETATVDAAVYATLTAIYENRELGTEIPHGKGKNQNQHEHETPSPTQTVVSSSTPTATIDWGAQEMDD